MLLMEEYLKSLIYTADFPTGKYNLANYYSNKQDFVKAEKLYNDAIKGIAYFYPAKSNLALLYYNQGKLQRQRNYFLI